MCIASELGEHRVGFTVVEVKPDSPLAGSVVVGDRILSVDGEELCRYESATEVMAILSARAHAQRVLTLQPAEAPVSCVKLPDGRFVLQLAKPAGGAKPAPPAAVGSSFVLAQCGDGGQAAALGLFCGLGCSSSNAAEEAPCAPRPRPAAFMESAPAPLAQQAASSRARRRPTPSLPPPETAPLPGEKDNTGDPAGESSRTTQCPTHVQRAREQHARRAFGLDEQVEQSPLTGKTFQTDSLTTQQTRKLTAKPGRRRSYTYSVV